MSSLGLHLLSSFSWATKIAATKANQQTACTRKVSAISVTEVMVEDSFHFSNAAYLKVSMDINSSISFHRSENTAVTLNVIGAIKLAANKSDGFSHARELPAIF